VFPLSHSAEIGPSDVHAVRRGHTQSVLDLADEAERSAGLLERAADIFRELAGEFWKRAPLFHGGYFDAQYSLWAPGLIVRMQEDAPSMFLLDGRQAAVDSRLVSRGRERRLMIHSIREGCS